MKKLYSIIFTLCLLFGVVGGATSVKAEKTYWSPASPWKGFANCYWDGEKSTFYWNGTHDVVRAIQTGFSGNLSRYTTFHANVSSLTGDGVTKLQLKVNCTGGVEKLIDLTIGENSIDMSDWFTDRSKVTTFELWGPKSSEAECSAVLTDVYLDESFDVTTISGFGDEITTIDYITGKNKFVIGNGTNAKYFYNSGNANENKNANVEDVPADAYFYFTLEKYDGDDIAGDNIYWIKITNANGEGYPNGTDGGCYLNSLHEVDWAHVVISAPQGGWSCTKDALWYVTYDAEKGFSFQNVCRATNGKGLKSWLSIGNNFEADQQYLKLYESIEFTSTTIYPADDETFALANASGYNAETGEMTNGTWTFDTPVDISNWKYLMITTANTAANASHEIKITDDNGVSVQGEGYSGSTAGTGGNMWLDRWNNQNAIRISIDYLKNEKSMDITKIKSLKISGTTKIANVYLTCYNNTKISGGYKAGDLVREYSATGKFGTICLPYKASVAGAEVYSIASGDASSITLTKINGLLEAGKPYFYLSTDEIGQNDAGTVRNVNFFRADFDHYDVPTPGSNNGLIGTFSEITAPAGSNYYILSGNVLYDTEGATGDDAITIGANKAYIDNSEVPASGGSVKGVTLFFNDSEATGVEAVQDAVPSVQGTEIYNMAGQRVARLAKGLYIIGGKKVLVK